MTNIAQKLREEHLPIVLLAFSFAGGSIVSLDSRPHDSRPPHAPVLASASRHQSEQSFVWPGTYDLIGTGFATGERFAVMTVASRDTSYQVDIFGPPGSLKSLQIVGDSAHIAWDMNGPVMMVDLRGSGDSLDGRWFLGTESGFVYGTRRR